MATLNFFIQSKGEQANIYVRFSVARGTDLKRKTGFIVDAKKWSKSKGQPVLKEEYLKNLKTDLDSFKNKIEKAFNSSVKNGKEITGEWLQEQINIINNKIPIENLDLIINYTNHIIEHAATRKNQKGGYGLSENRIKVYAAFIVIIKRYQKYLGKQVYIRDIDLKFANTFTKWLLEEKYNINTVGKFISNMKTVCNDAKVNGVKVSEQLSKIEVVNEKKESEEIVYLSFDELEKIENAMITQESLVNARKWLLMGCYLGQRGGDLLNVTADNIKQLNNIQAIELEQKKTAKNVVIPLLPKAQEIIDNGFPYKIAIQNFNKYIKEICRIAEINTPTKGKVLDATINRKVKGVYPKYELISSHVCRRSFASNFYGDIPTSILMNITAHGTETMFLRYIGKSNYDNAYQMVDYFNKIGSKKGEPKLTVVKKDAV